MPNKLISILTKCMLFLGFLALLSSCRVGEEDPFLSLRSRDNRLKANWKMSKLENRIEVRSFEPGSLPVTTVINGQFDGIEMRVRTYLNGNLVSDSTFGFSYQMRLKEKGETSFDYTVIYFGLAGLKSGGDDNWYWQNSDKKKAAVYLGSALQFPTTIGIGNFLPPAISFALGGLVTDFTIEGLRKEELQLSFSKSSNQTTSTGGLQQIILNSNMTFDAK